MSTMLNTKLKDNKVEPTANSDKTSVVSGQLEKQIENKKKNRRKKGAQRTKPERGVVFIKNIPHGFYEEQIKKYFEQIGRVTRIRLVRSKRTGNDKGFAYVEFQYPEVAKEAAKSVHNKVMFKKIVKAAYIPPEEQKFNYFKTGLKAVRNAVGKLKFVSKVTRYPIETAKAVNNWVPENYFSRIYRKNLAVQKIRDAFVAYGLDPDLVPDNPKTLTRDDMDDRFEKIMEEKNRIMEERKEKRRAQREAEEQERLKNNLNDDSDVEHGDASPKVGKLLLTKKRQRSSEKESQKLGSESAKSTEKEIIRDLKIKTSPCTIQTKKPIKKKKNHSSLTEEPVSKKVRSQSTESEPVKTTKASKPKRNLKVKDLLGKSLLSDDSDEDFIPEVGSDEKNEQDKKASNSSPSTEQKQNSQLTERASVKKSKVTKSKKHLEVKDLLGKSLLSDDSDDDFIPGKDSDGTDESDEDEHDEESYDSIPSKEEHYEKPAKNYVQILKSQKVEKPKKILKRNPLSGAIHKPTKKLNKDKNSTLKKELKIAAAKEIMKDGIKPQLKKKVKKMVKKH